MDVLLVNPYHVRSALQSPASGGSGEGCCGHLPNTPKILSNINVGVLSLATRLSRDGATTRILDLSNGPGTMVDLERVLTAEEPRFLGVSCLYYSTYPALVEIARLARRIVPTISIVAGGSHAGAIPSCVLAEIPEVDAVCAGEAEESLSAMISLPRDQWHRLPGVHTRNGGGGWGTPVTNLGSYRYDLYPDWLADTFLLEESRGCPYGCRFCAHIPHFKERPLPAIAEDLDQFLAMTPCEHPQIMVGSDTFGVSSPRTRDLLTMLTHARRTKPFWWGTQTRVDAKTFLDDSYPELLQQSGLRSLSLGLESGSPFILELMNKTSKPTQYLQHAARLIRRLGSVEGLQLRLNVMIYVGETISTIGETRAFLESMRGSFSGVHVAVIHAYPKTALWENLDSLEANYGTTRVRSCYWDAVHAFPLNPAATVSFALAQEHAASWRAAFNASPDRDRMTFPSGDASPQTGNVSEESRPIS